MRLNDLFENNNKNRGYEPGFASPNAPSLGGRRQNDEPDGVNNIEVSINGRVWKIFAGAGLDSSPEFFRQKQKVDDMCKRKTQETGKKWTWGVTGAPATNESLAKNKINEFAPGQGGGDSGNYFQALASAWYNGTFDSGSLQKGIKSQEDVERLLQRGIVCPDGVTRKFDIGYNSNFDGVVISSDDYYEHADHDETDSRTGKPFGPYDYMEFGDDDLDESAKYRDPKYKDKLYTQEKPDYNDTREYDDARWNPKPDNYPGRKRKIGGGEFSHNDPLRQGFGRSGIKNSILDRGKRKGLPSRDQITSLKGSIKDAHGRHTRANLPEGMEGQVVFSGTGADGGKYEIIQSGPTDFMIHANGRHIDTYGSLQRAMSVLKNEVPGLQQGMTEGSLNEFAPSVATGGGKKDYGQPVNARYMGGNKFVVGTTNNYILTATIDKYGLDWDDGWYLDSPGAAHLSDASEGEIPLPISTEQRHSIHDTVTDYLNARNQADLQKVARHFGHGDDGQMNEQGMAEAMMEPPVNLNQPARDTGARTFAAPGSDSITAEPLAPSKFNPGSEKTLTSPPAANTSSTVDAGLIGNAFQMAQDDNQKRINDRAAMAANSPADAKQMKLNYQNSIVNPEFLNDLTDPEPEPVTPAKPAANNTSTNSLTTSPNIWQGAGDPKDFGGGVVKPPSKSGVVTKAQLDAYRRDSGNPTATLGQYMNQQKGLTARKGGANDPAVIAAKQQAAAPSKVKESAAQTDLYQILRNAGLKNTP